MTQANPGPKHNDCSESLSRLIDGELDDSACRALFKRLESDADARRTWVLLNVACDAMRSSETAALHSAGFMGRVSVALEAEPVVLAPGRVRRRAVLLRRVGLPAAAVAAAAVVLAVVAVPQLRGGNPTPIEQASVPPSAPAAAGPEVVRSDEFEAYIAAHRETGAGPVSSRAAEIGGVIPATMESR
jgi:negative regulator of sigma E activity